MVLSVVCVHDRQTLSQVSMKSPTQKKDIEAEDEDSMEPFSAQKSFHPNEQKFHSASIKD